MADLTSYAGLCEAVADYLGRDDMTDRIPTFIALAERRMNRDLRLRVMERRAGSGSYETRAHYAYLLSLVNDFMK